MKFIFKMFVLVGLILVGKFLKEDSADTVVQRESVGQDIYSFGTNRPVPFIQPANHLIEPIIKEGDTTEQNFTYSLN
jgi:hypothetical protein